MTRDVDRQGPTEEDRRLLEGLNLSPATEQALFEIRELLESMYTEELLRLRQENSSLRGEVHVLQREIERLSELHRDMMGGVR